MISLPIPSCFSPPFQHPEGLVYAEVNVKPKSSAKPRVPKPDKTDDRVEYATIAYQPKDAAEKSLPVVESTSRRMALPDNPGMCVKYEYSGTSFSISCLHYMYIVYASNRGWVSRLGSMILVSLTNMAGDLFQVMIEVSINLNTYLRAEQDMVSDSVPVKKRF